MKYLTSIFAGLIALLPVLTLPVPTAAQTPDEQGPVRLLDFRKLGIDPKTGEVLVPHRTWRAEATAKNELPLSVDHNKSSYFPPIISQIGGSCAQASTIGYMCTYELNRLLDRPADRPEHRLSYLFTWNLINGGIDQGSIGKDGMDIAFNSGLMSEADFPSQTSPYQFKWATGYDKYYRALQNRVVKFNDITVDSEEGVLQLKQYLYNKNKPGESGGIVIFSSQAEGWIFNDNYNGPSETGYTSLLTRLATNGPHGMTITGYDDLIEFTAPDGSLQKGAFIVTNTHGTFRHDHGKFYLPYWFFTHNDQTENLSPLVVGADMATSHPQLLFKVNFEYSSRDDLEFRLGVSPNPTDHLPVHDYQTSLFNHQGGDHPMQGAYAEPAMEVAFDFSRRIPLVEKMETPTYFLSIIRANRGSVHGKGKLYSVSVYDYRKDAEHPEIHTQHFGGIEIPEGKSVYRIPTTEAEKCSCSPVEWLSQNGKPVAAPFVIKTAKGKYAKVRFGEYDRKSGTLTIRYVYNPNGGRQLK